MYIKIFNRKKILRKFNNKYYYRKIHRYTYKKFSSSSIDNQYLYTSFDYRNDPENDNLENNPNRINFIHPLRTSQKECEILSENEEICFMDIGETNQILNSKQYSMEDIINHHSKRLEVLQPYYRPFITHTKGILKNSLDAYIKNNNINSTQSSKHAFIFHIKDYQLTHINIPYTRGSLYYKDSKDNSTHHIVQLLKDNNGFLIGTTSVPEFAYCADTRSKIIGITRNPHNPQLTAGGSSGGSAVAISCGIGHVAICNDGFGAIRIPASMNGLIGIKPRSALKFGKKNGRLINFGSGSMAYGTITRTVKDAAFVFDLLLDSGTP